LRKFSWALLVITVFLFLGCSHSPQIITVYFETDGGTIIECISIESGSFLSLPENPSKQGFYFAGWHTDENFTIGFNQWNPVTENSVLYAQWSDTEINENLLLLGHPGHTPEVFAPGFISTELNSEFSGTFSPDYLHYFYTRRTETGTNRLYYTFFHNGEWSVPELSPISEDVTEAEPFITNDGSTLYFQSRRENPNKIAVYQSSFIGGVWQEPVLSSNGLNDILVMYITVADSGNIYFTGFSGNSPGIYVIEYMDGIYLPAKFTGISGAHPYIAPDESYILLDQGFGSADYIFISLNNNGSWTYPVKLSNEVNQTGANQICPSVTTDGKFFFFSRFVDGKSDIFWVDSDYLLPYL